MAQTTSTKIDNYLQIFESPGFEEKLDQFKSILDAKKNDQSFSLNNYLNPPTDNESGKKKKRVGKKKNELLLSSDDLRMLFSTIKSKTQNNTHTLPGSKNSRVEALLKMLSEDSKAENEFMIIRDECKKNALARDNNVVKREPLWKIGSAVILTTIFKDKHVNIGSGYLKSLPVEGSNRVQVEISQCKPYIQTFYREDMIIGSIIDYPHSLLSKDKTEEGIDFNSILLRNPSPSRRSIIPINNNLDHQSSSDTDQSNSNGNHQSSSSNSNDNGNSNSGNVAGMEFHASNNTFPTSIVNNNSYSNHQSSNDTSTNHQFSNSNGNSNTGNVIEMQSSSYGNHQSSNNNNGNSNNSNVAEMQSSSNSNSNSSNAIEMQFPSSNSTFPTNLANSYFVHIHDDDEIIHKCEYMFSGESVTKVNTSKPYTLVPTRDLVRITDLYKQALTNNSILATQVEKDNYFFQCLRFVSSNRTDIQTGTSKDMMLLTFKSKEKTVPISEMKSFKSMQINAALDMMIEWFGLEESNLCDDVVEINKFLMLYHGRLEFNVDSFRKNRYKHTNKRKEVDGVESSTSKKKKTIPSKSSNSTSSDSSSDSGGVSNQ